MELACSGFFTAEFALRLYVAEDRWHHFFTWESAVDQLTILPPFLELSLRRAALVDFGFLRCARLLRLLRILRVHRLMTRTDSLIQRKVLVLCFSMLTLIVCSAGAFLETEYEQVSA